MKKCVVVLVSGVLLMSGCSCSMPSHTTENEMNKVVKKTLEEPYEYVECIGGDDYEYLYLYQLTDRNISFISYSRIEESDIDGEFVTYYHSNEVCYESAIVSDEKNIEIRKKCAEKYGVYDRGNIYTINMNNDDYVREVDFTTSIESFNELGMLTDFIIEMDSVYDFDENNIKNINRVENHIYYIESNEEYPIATIEYAPYGDKKLSFEQLYPYLEEQYVLMVKQYGIIDSTIPDDVYEKYTEEDE